MKVQIDFKTVFINVITAIVLALLLEFALGYMLRNPDAIPDSLLSSYRSYYQSKDRNIFQVTDCAGYDAEFFYKFHPGECAFENREFNVANQFNSAGLRDDEQSLKNPSIITFGDSFTMGWGVSQETCFPQILESLSQERVLNAGISSFGTAREMKLLDKLGVDRVKTVIIQYHSNDYEENLTSIENNFSVPISPEYVYDSLKKNIADRNRYYPFKYLAGISRNLVGAPAPGDQESTVNDTLEARAFLDILMHSRITSVASRILVFKIDNGVNDDKFVDAIDQLMQRDDQYGQLNLTTVRLNGLLNKSDYFILDPHINESGHKKLAVRLFDYLKKPDAAAIAGQPKAE